MEFETETESESENLSELDRNTEFEPDVEYETEPGSETQTEKETEPLTEAVSELLTEIDRELETETEFITETSAETSAKSEAEMSVLTETETELLTESIIAPESEFQTEAETELLPEMETAEEIETESEFSTETESEAVSENKSQTEPETEISIEFEPDIELQSEPETELPENGEDPTSIHNVTLDGCGYQLTLTYTDSAQIPEDARFEFQAIKADNSEYTTYETRALETVTAAAATDANNAESNQVLGLFDVSIFDASGEVVQPESSVHVNVTFDNKITGYDSVRIVHFVGSSIGVETGPVLKSGVKKLSTLKLHPNQLIQYWKRETLCPRQLVSGLNCLIRIIQQRML